MFFIENKLLFLGVLISILISLIFIFISFFLIKKEFSIEKTTPYECGFQPFSDSRFPFDVHFYLVALLFLIFDLEVVFLLPWVMYIYVNFYSFVIIIIFLIILTLGFFYEWKKGALTW